MLHLFLGGAALQAVGRKRKFLDPSGAKDWLPPSLEMPIVFLQQTLYVLTPTL